MFRLSIILAFSAIQLSACVSGILHETEPALSVPAGSTYNEHGEYLLGQGDRLALIVVERPELNLGLSINAAGMVQHPFFSLKASGRTLDDLSSDIAKHLRPYVAKPTILVKLEEPTSFKVYLSGEINKPGAYALDRQVWLGDLIAMGGGMTRFAAKRVLLIRSLGGEHQRFVILYEELIKGTGTLDKVFLERGDHVHLL